MSASAAGISSRGAACFIRRACRKRKNWNTRRAISPRSRSTRPSTARRSRKASANGRRPCLTVLCFQSKDRASPPTAVCWRKRANSIKRFLDTGVLELGDRLGPLLWQFAPTKKLDPADFGKFLELLPAKAGNTALRHVVEVRHPSFCAPDFVALARSFHIPIVFTDHARYPSLADATGDFIYARLQKGQDTIPTAYPPKELDAWTKRLRLWAEGKSPEDLPHIDAASAPKTAAPRDVFAYVIHEGKVRAPLAAMALIERIGTGNV